MAWQIDPAHTQVLFSARHMMITTVRGEFKGFEGTVEFNEENPVETTVNIEIDVASISTREEQRDGHLKSPDFFNVEQFPKIVFKSTSVEVTGDNTAKLTGDLTIKDITKPVTLDVVYHGQGQSPWGQTVAGFEAKGVLNRTDWGLTWNQALETGGVLVSEEIKIELEVELIKQAEGATA